MSVSRERVSPIATLLLFFLGVGFNYKRWGGVLACASIWIGFLSTGTSQTSLPEIVTFDRLKNLTREEAAGDRPVRLKGVVLCYDSGWDKLYVHDGHETGYLHPGEFQTQLKPGQLVEITGTTPGGNS